jgi:hypothetical protein
MACGLVLALAVTCTNVTSADKDMPEIKSPISVSIAIPVHHGHRSLNTADHFHVVVVNASDKPVRLWSDRFSWGYDNLSFELVADDGAVTPITKKPRGWDKNFPDWLELPPGGSYVLNVDWFSAAGREIWENAPLAGGAAPKPRLFKLRAVYEIKPDGESKKLGVWTGKIASPVDVYAVW